MPSRPETAAPAPGPLVTGHFHSGPRYATWREQGTRDWLLIYTVRGSGRCGHAAGEIITEPGDAVLLRPGCRHDYGTAPGQRRWEIYWAHFVPRPDWVEWLAWPEEAPGLHRLRLAGSPLRPRISRRLAEMVRRNARSHPRHEALARNALEEALLWCDAANPRSREAAIDARVRRAADFICGHLEEPLPLARVAAAAGLSVSRLARLFRETMGQTPQRFTELQRMTRARQLLRFTQEPVKEIARRVGFENPFYFTARFTRHTGVSPRAFRRQAR